MRGAIPPPSGSHRLGSFVETNKTATRDTSGRLSSAHDKATLYHTERTADLEPSNVRNRDHGRRSNPQQRRAFFSKRRAGYRTIERQNTVYEGGVLL